MLSLLDMVQQHLVQELLFPESRLVGTTIANTQAYFLPDCHRIYRVYLNGQIIVEVPGGIDTLEGRQIGLYDQTAQGSPVAGSDAPPGSGGVAQPHWTTQTPSAYPYISSYGAPAPLTQPSFIGSMPRYYRRDGEIGITPAPAGAGSLVVDGVFCPPTLTTTVQTLTVPQYFYDALTWYTVMMMKFADDTSSTQDQRNFAETKYQEHLKKLRTTVRQYRFKDLTTLVRNDRSQYAFGRSRVGYGSELGP